MHWNIFFNIKQNRNGRVHHHNGNKRKLINYVYLKEVSINFICLKRQL